jgi:hypothetical protein
MLYAVLASVPCVFHCLKHSRLKLRSTATTNTQQQAAAPADTVNPQLAIRYCYMSALQLRNVLVYALSYYRAHDGQNIISYNTTYTLLCVPMLLLLQ